MLDVVMGSLPWILLLNEKSLIIGVDINKKNIEIAKNYKFNKSLDNIEFIHGDISSQMNLKSDVVILSNILEHISERTAFLKYYKNQVQVNF